MTFDNKDESPELDGDVDRRGLAKLLEALGQVPPSGIAAMEQLGVNIVYAEENSPKSVRAQRLGSNVVKLF